MLLDTTLASIEGSFEGANANHVDIPDDLPVVWVDREAISQVIVNLVSNAVKYGGMKNGYPYPRNTRRRV